MISAWNLLWIVPMAMVAGIVLLALYIGYEEGKEIVRRMHEED